MTPQEIADVLASLQPALQGEERVELRATHHETGELYREWYTSHATLAAEAVRLTLRGYHAWYGVALRNGRRGGDANCTRTLALIADIDDKLYGDDHGEALAAIEAFPMQPSAVISSGGGFQVYWLLAEPLNLTEHGGRYREAATRLPQALCGPERRPDTVSNPERLLRVPGTLNHKYDPARPVGVGWLHLDRRYRLLDLELWLREHAAWTEPPPPKARTSEGTTSDVITDFNRRYDLLGLLARHGATLGRSHGQVLPITRPGKRAGISATYGYYPDTLHVFTSEWVPFRQNGGYDAFECFSLLEHRGDRKAAYKAAYDLGYGERRPALVLVQGQRARRLPEPCRPRGTRLPELTRPGAVGVGT